MRIAAFAMGAACMLALEAVACGVCLEDKVAATYDHQLVQGALKRGRVVVFAEPRANVDADTLTRRIAAAAADTRGVERASVRTAQAPLALSFVLDPQAAKPADAVAAIARAAHVPGLQLVTLRVIQ